METDDGRTVLNVGLNIGNASNNVAEFIAAAMALEMLVDAGVQRCNCFTDSELLVKQLNGVDRSIVP